MRFMKALTVLFFAFSLIALAADHKLGVRDTYHVKFQAATHIGTSVLPAGEYVVRHTMEGEDHIMVFRHEDSRKEFKVKCSLVPLGHKAERDETIYALNAANERVLQEMVFRGDTAKHVF
jgi:hypothetical protein